MTKKTHGTARIGRDGKLGRGKVEPQYLSVADAEIYSGISLWTWRAYAYAGKVASTKVGTRLLISKQEIDRILAEGTRPAAKAS